MKNWLFQLLFPGTKVPAGDQQWVWNCEGLSGGLVFLLALLLIAAAAWAYLRFAPGLGRKLRIALIVLRSIGIVLLLLLLAKPVLNLTINEPVRQSLLVLVDDSQSMQLVDPRKNPEDVNRAAIAAGVLNGDADLKQNPSSNAKAVANLSRSELLRRLAANDTLNLWQKLHERSDLLFYSFGRNATQVGPLEPTASGAKLTAGDAGKFFANFKAKEPSTAIGESIRQALDQSRSQALSGLLLITDGANNGGLPPPEAARLAHEQNVPLFIYGMGIALPPDLILHELSAPKLAFANEKAEVTLKLRTQAINGKEVGAVLRANGKEVARQTIRLDQNGEYEGKFSFVAPKEPGELVLEATIPALPEEVSKDNNLVTAKLRVVENKIHVLLIDQDPRWDFRYLLAYLQRDRRLEVKTVLIDGEPGLESFKDSPFLAALPEDREGLFRYEIIILGDVDPKSLGETRMKLLREWVEQTGGGLIFHAGRKFNPFAYANTPLEALLPVVPDDTVTPENRGKNTTEPTRLQLTALGETSSYLKMNEYADENRRLWENFQPLRWTAQVQRAKPGAQVLLVDPSASRATREGPLPVMAVQEYGAGETVYLGTDETYRWRSRVGEKYYSQIWGLVMQSLSLQRLQGASSRTHLKTERLRYFVGDKIRVAGKVYQKNYEILTTPSLPGRFKIEKLDKSIKEIPFEVTSSDETGVFSGEFTAEIPGTYFYTNFEDPDATLKFEVIEAKLEQTDTALNERLLQAMATVSKGRFVREENLHQLPDLISERSATVATLKKFELFHAPIWLVLILLFAFAEWFLRRWYRLK